MRISDTEKAVQLVYLYDPDKDDRDLHSDHMIYDPPQRSSEWGPRPYSLSEIVYEYDTEDDGRRGHERDTQDHYHAIASYPLNQYHEYLDDGGRRRYVHTDTGMSNFTHSGNPDSNSRTVTGQRITIISDQTSHLSETKPTENGTRRLTLDHSH